MRQQSIFKQIVASVLFCGLALSSCSEPKDNTSPDGGDEVTKPSIEISNVVAASESVTFTVTPTDAVEFKYSVVESGENPEFTSVRSSKAREIKIDKLTQGVEYEITAVAYNTEYVSSDSTTATFTTEELVTYPRTCIAYKFTATWCTACPYMTAAIDEVLEDDPSSLAVIAIHDEMAASLAQKYNTEEGDKLIGEWNVTGLPTLKIDYRVTSDASASSIKGVINASNDYATTSNIAIASSIEDGVAKIKVDSKFGATARYKLCVVVTENNISEPNSEGSETGLYHHVVRKFLTSSLGDVLGKQDLGSNNSKEFECELDSSWNADELEVTAIILKEEGTNRYYGNNAAVSPISGSVDFK